MLILLVSLVIGVGVAQIGMSLEANHILTLIIALAITLISFGLIKFLVKQTSQPGQEKKDVMKNNLGIKFWLNAILGFFTGLLCGFASCFFFGQIKSLTASVIFGFIIGLISGYGILFRLPDKELSEAKMGRYIFWPVLMPGAAQALTYAAYPLTITFLGVIGFMVSLLLYFRKEFGKTAENEPRP